MPKATTKTKKKVKTNAKKYYEAVGRRKTSTARVRLHEKGKGNFKVNDKRLEEYFKLPGLQQISLKPLKTTNYDNVFDISVKVKGGGIHSQAEAISLGIAKSLIKVDKKLRPTLKKEGFLKRDPRMKERKKPGLKRARRGPQWSKR